MKNKPIIIIGAGRSGTNILRDVLCAIEGFETWPCDEINYIWRHGNITEPTDEFNAKHVTPAVQKYIRNTFRKFERKSEVSTIVEKTCANSLRVSFVNEIFPEAKFIHIIRDGRAVVNSARKRWTAELELDYIVQKAKYIPFTDVPYYALKYFRNRVHRLFSDEGKLASWGPRFKGIDRVIQKHTLEEVCAIQWKKCVEKAANDLSQLDSGRIFSIRYEDFTMNTKEEVKKILLFLDVDYQNIDVRKLTGMVHLNSKDKWKKELTEQQIQNINAIIHPTLMRLRYKR